LREIEQQNDNILDRCPVLEWRIAEKATSGLLSPKYFCGVNFLNWENELQFLYWIHLSLSTEVRRKAQLQQSMPAF